MLLVPKKKCPVCGGLLNLTNRFRKVIVMERKDGSKSEVVRISEHWHCHNGHLHMQNYKEAGRLIINE